MNKSINEKKRKEEKIKKKKENQGKCIEVRR